VNAIEKLKALDASATPRPWLQSLRSDQVYHRHATGTVNVLRTWNWAGRAPHNRALLIALRNLAPEVLAVLEAVEVEEEMAGVSPNLSGAMAAFRARAAQALGV
jgi:hypothetical protein